MLLIESKESIVCKIATDITDEYKVRSYGLQRASSDFSEHLFQEATLKLFMIDSNAECSGDEENQTEILKPVNYNPNMKIIYNVENITNTIVQGTNYSPIDVVSSDFMSADTYLNHALKGKNFLLYWNNINRFISKIDSEWVPLSTGGFKILIPDFNASINNYEFIIYPID